MPINEVGGKHPCLPRTVFITNPDRGGSMIYLQRRWWVPLLLLLALST